MRIISLKGKKLPLLMLSGPVFMGVASAASVIGWQQDFGTNLQGATTDSPSVGNGTSASGQCILWATIPEYTLANVGDSITLSFDWTLTGSTVTTDFFRYGLFDVNGSSDQGNWLGYKAYSGGIFEQNGVGGGDFGSTSGTRGALLAGSAPTVSGTSGNKTYSFSMTIALVSTGVQIDTAVTGTGYSYVSSVLDTTPQNGETPIVYNRIGLTQTGSANPDLVEFEGVDVTFVPEPSTMAVMGLGGVLLLLRRRR